VRIARRGESQTNTPWHRRGCEHNLPPPRERGCPPISIHDEGVATKAHLLTTSTVRLDKCAGHVTCQVRHQPRMLRVQIFEHQAFVRSDLIDLLVRRRRVKEASRVDVFGQRRVRPLVMIPGPEPMIELCLPLGPCGRDGPVADGLDGALTAWNVHAGRLQVRHGNGSARIRGPRERHPNRVCRARPSGGALPTQRHPGEPRGADELVVQRERTIPEDPNRLVDRPNHETRLKRGNRIALRCVGVPNEHHVNATLEGHKVGAPEEATTIVSILVGVGYVGFILNGS